MEETNKKIKVVGPKVINVGYRLYILEEAERRKIARLDMKNVRDKEKKKETVEILLGDDKEKINEFIRWIRFPSNIPEKAEIDKDGILEEDYSGDIMSREEYYKIFTNSQLSKMASSGGELLEIQTKMFETQTKILETQNKILEVQSKMFEKQKEISDSVRDTVDIQTDIGTRISRLSSFGQDIVSTQDEIKNKISQIGRDLKRYIDERIGKLELEIVKRT